MSVVPASLDIEARSASRNAPTQESRTAPEKDFQDAIDAQRSERAHAGAKQAEARQAEAKDAEAKQASRVRDERVQHERDAGSDASESAKGESSTEDGQRAEDSRSESPRDGESNQAAHDTDRARSPRTATESSQATTEDSSATRPGRANAASNGASARVHFDASTDALESTPELPWLARVALESVFARAMQGAVTDSIASRDVAPAASAPSNSTNVAAPADSAGLAHAPTANALATRTLDTLLATTARDADAAPRHASTSTNVSPVAVDARGANAVHSSAALIESKVASTVPARVTPSELPSFLEHLAVTFDGRERAAVVDLEPADLGRLRIALSLEPGGHVRAELRAERPAGYAALQARMPELQAGWIERGFASASMSLSLGLAERNAQHGGGERELTKPSSGARRTLADAEVLAMVPARASGAIDMWA
jgi:hypothetical protein